MTGAFVCNVYSFLENVNVYLHIISFFNIELYMMAVAAHVMPGGRASGAMVLIWTSSLGIFWP